MKYNKLAIWGFLLVYAIPIFISIAMSFIETAIHYWYFVTYPLGMLLSLLSLFKIRDDERGKMLAIISLLSVILYPILFILIMIVGFFWPF